MMVNTHKKFIVAWRTPDGQEHRGKIPFASNVVDYIVKVANRERPDVKHWKEEFQG